MAKATKKETVKKEEVKAINTATAKETAGTVEASNQGDVWVGSEQEKKLREEAKPKLREEEIQEKTALTFYDKLLIDKEQLEEKTISTKAFIDKNPIYNKLDQVQQNLLVMQYQHMEKYLDCLDRRIGILKPAIVEEV